MRYLIHILGVGMLLAATAFPQSPTPTSTPIEDKGIVKISTALVRVDVTATDSRGRIVSDLGPTDFELYENGKLQKITEFSFVSARQKGSSEKPAVEDGISAPPSINRIKPSQIRRTIALVVDDLTLSFESVHFVRRALRKFVNEQMQDGDLVAIIRTGGGVGALQQFTFDKRQLTAAIEKVRWNPIGSGGVGAFDAIEPTPLEQLRANGGRVTEEEIEEERRQLRENDQYRESLFATGTLGAVNYVIRGMKELPGRKSIVLLSDGFRLFLPEAAGFSSTRVLGSLRDLVDLANRSSVIVYTIDAKGLQPGGLTAADNTSVLSTSGVQNRLADRRDDIESAREGLAHLAKETGGLSFFNSNDINAGIRKILNDQSYYLLGYEPDSESFDTETRKFNKLEVKVKRSGVKARYRSGFFGVPDKVAARPSVRNPGQKLVHALTSPFAVNDINLSLNTIFKRDKNQKLSLSSFVHINTKDLEFQDDQNSIKKAAFDVLAMSFGDNGVPISKISKTYTIGVKEDQFEKFLDQGIVYFFTFPVEKPGAYQMRVAIRDHGTDKVGSASLFTEVPNLRKNRLTLSGLAIENLTLKQWGQTQETGVRDKGSDPLIDTSLRKFKRGTVLTYGVEIYNARLGNSKTPELNIRTRVFHNGKPLYEGKNAAPKNLVKGPGSTFLTNGAIALGTGMSPGDYVLQIIVTDKLSKKKHRIATQFVQFELID